MTDTAFSPVTWARDFALLGLSTGALAPFFVVLNPHVAVVSGVVGAVSGALLGACLAPVMSALRGRVPLALLWPLATALGALWGAVSAGRGALEVGSMVFWPGVALGIATGTVLVGVGFLPYLMLDVRGRSTLPLVALGVLASPVMGWVGLLSFAAMGLGLWVVALPVSAGLGALLYRAERRALGVSDPPR